MTRHLLALATSLLGACTADVPPAPSFQQHVMPILAANCVRCHGYPAIGGAPPGFRLDSYEDVAIDDATTVAGAGAYAALIAVRVRDEARPMPPRFALDEPQIETLERWAAGALAGELPPRGEPRPGNRAPLVAIEDLSRSGNVLTIVLRVDDPDGDLVAGELRVQLPGVERVIGPVRSGRVELAWNTAFVGDGSYPLAARVDDGAMPISIDLGQITVGGP
ncbi:MAG TPA: hypothetical protein VK932_15525 [Kofleriaceae bacterium]|nr:hypothetical protein [Kofleriaceae bacterium]